jgi:hypothetical protein
VNGAALTANLSSAPLRLDLWLRQPTATNTATPFLLGRMDVVTVQGTTALPFSAAVSGTTSMTSNQTLTCVWQWASAAATNTVTINSGVLLVGE